VILHGVREIVKQLFNMGLCNKSDNEGTRLSLRELLSKNGSDEFRKNQNTLKVGRNAWKLSAF
jgi:hypothetical protein